MTPNCRCAAEAQLPLTVPMSSTGHRCVAHSVLRFDPVESQTIHSPAGSANIAILAIVSRTWSGSRFQTSNSASKRSSTTSVLSVQRAVQPSLVVCVTVCCSTSSKTCFCGLSIRWLRVQVPSASLPRLADSIYPASLFSTLTLPALSK